LDAAAAVLAEAERRGQGGAGGPLGGQVARRQPAAGVAAEQGVRGGGGEGGGPAGPGGVGQVGGAGGEGGRGRGPSGGAGQAPGRPHPAGPCRPAGRPGRAGPARCPCGGAFRGERGEGSGSWVVSAWAVSISARRGRTRANPRK